MAIAFFPAVGGEEGGSGVAARRGDGYGAIFGQQQGRWRRRRRRRIILGPSSHQARAHMWGETRRLRWVG